MTFKDKLEELKANPPVELYTSCFPMLVEYIDNAHEEEDNIVGTSRWGLLHKAVWEYEGRYWQVRYEEPATEYQEWDNEFEVYEVFGVPRIITEWVRL